MSENRSCILIMSTCTLWWYETTVKLVLILLAFRGVECELFDVTTAYLNADLTDKEHIDCCIVAATH